MPLWAAEEIAHAREVVERVPEHAIGEKMKAAYRQEMMQGLRQSSRGNASYLRYEMPLAVTFSGCPPHARLEPLGGHCVYSGV